MDQASSGVRVLSAVSVLRLEVSTDGGETFGLPVLDRTGGGGGIRELVFRVGESGLVRVLHGAYLDFAEGEARVQ